MLFYYEQNSNFGRSASLAFRVDTASNDGFYLGGNYDIMNGYCDARLSISKCDSNGNVEKMWQLEATC